MEIQAYLSNLRISPRKVRAVAAMLPGLSVQQASVQLECELRRAALPLKKLLLSAIANAEHNFHSVSENLIVSRVVVNEGKKLKRWMPRAQGRATPIWKRMSEIRMTLNEIDPLVKSSRKKAERKRSIRSVGRKSGISEGSFSSSPISSGTGGKRSTVRTSQSSFHRKSI